MTSDPLPSLLAALAELRRELADTAATLDFRRQPAAADVAATLAAQLGELADRFTPAAGAGAGRTRAPLRHRETPRTRG